MATTRIMIVNPNTTTSMTDAVLAAARRVAGDSTELIGGTPARGVPSVESHFDEAWGTLGVLHQIRQGESEGADGYVIACFGDTGVLAGRELAAGPVVGMTEAALFTAAVLAHRFSIITMPQRTIAHADRVVRAIGLEHRCTVRALDIAVADIGVSDTAVSDVGGAPELGALFIAEARDAVAQDGAEAIILGCAGLAELSEPMTEALGIPVIDGVLAAVTMVQGLLAQDLRTSRGNTFARPDRANQADLWTNHL